jgi:hypothetical protein
MGLSAPGRAFVTKALHPPGNEVSPGIPDTSEATSLRPEFRVQHVISPPAASSTSWDCYIWSPPGDTVGFFWATVPSGTTNAFATESLPPGGESGFVSIQETVVNASPETWYLLSISAATANPVASMFSVSSVAPVNSTFAYRTMYKSLTAELVASSVADQGSVYASQHAPTHVVTMGTDVGLNPVGPSAICHPRAFFAPPVDEGTMSLMCPDYHEGPAREGVFLPLRLTGPDQEYATRVPMNGITTVGAPPRLTLPFNVNGASPNSKCVAPAVFSNFSPWTDSVQAVPTWWTSPTSSPNVPISTGIDNVNQGVIIFRNLTGAASGVFPASIRVKTVVGLEIIPHPLSPDRVFTRPPAQYDPRALEAYYSLSREMRSAYPADFNSLATVLAVASRVAQALWPVAKTIGPALIAKYLETRSTPTPKPPPPKPRKPAPKASKARVRK